MPKSCRAPHCSNAAGQPRGSERRLSFYKFPLQDSARLQLWLAQMQQEHWVPTRHQHLCSDHFEPHCFEYRWGVRYLRPDAVPTIFPPPKNPTDPALVPKAAPKRSPHPRVPPPQPPAAPPAVANNVLQLLEPRDGLPPPAALSHHHPPPPPQSPPQPLVLSMGPDSVLPPSGELSTAQLAALLLGLQRKLKGLQQRRRRQRARLRELEGLLEELCPQPPGSVPIVRSVPPPEGTTGDIGDISSTQQP